MKCTASFSMRPRGRQALRRQDRYEERLSTYVHAARAEPELYDVSCCRTSTAISCPISAPAGRRLAWRRAPTRDNDALFERHGSAPNTRNEQGESDRSSVIRQVMLEYERDGGGRRMSSDRRRDSEARPDYDMADCRNREMGDAISRRWCSGRGAVIERTWSVNRTGLQAPERNGLARFEQAG